MLDPALKNEIDDLLTRSPWFIRIPDGLRAEYKARKLAHFARLARYGSPLLILLYIGMNVLTWLLYHKELAGQDLRYWIISDSIIGIIILTGTTLAQFPRWQASYTRWIPLLMGIALMTKVLCALSLQNQEIAYGDMYIALMIVAVGSLTLGLPASHGMATNIISILAFPVAFSLLEHTPNLLEFFLFYISVIALFSGISLLNEHQMHINFLQEILLENESAEIQRLNKELAALARRDALTGLANRRAFDESLAMEWDRALREKTSIALLMVDVDHFKLYNDSYGHPAGDACLARVAALLEGIAQRPGDLAARYGGEEFALLLPDTGMSGALEMAQRLLEETDRLALPHNRSTTAAHVTTSIGIAAGVPLPGMSLQQLVDNADAALYDAKHAGRHRFSHHELGMPATSNTATKQADTMH